MSITINTNISSMLGITALNRNTGTVNKALERLSTGSRINSSKDDAAGCAISTSLNKDISSLVVAQNNAQMGQSMIDTANGSLSNISNLLQRMRDLTEQAANGTYGTDERRTMQTEISNLVTELYRTKNSTEFNGKQVLGTEETKMTEAEAEAAGYAVVKTAQELKTSLTTAANCKVMLFADIDLNDLELDETGSNWTAVGDNENPFIGTLDGNGFTISNLKINRPDTNYQGLIGYSSTATLKDVIIENADVVGNNYNGILSGYIIRSKAINCSVSGTITGSAAHTGGITGTLNASSEMTNCNASVTVTGGDKYTGGLVGEIANSSKVINCSASANVTGNNSRIGGLAGVVGHSSSVTNCSSSGTVDGSGTYKGGLVGYCYNSSITGSKTTSVVLGTGTNPGAFLGDWTDPQSSAGVNKLEGNVYNSTINGENMRAVGNKASTPEDQVKDDKELVIDPNKQEQKEINPVNLQVGIKDDEFSTVKVDTGFEIGLFNINIETQYGASMALERIDKLMSKVTKKQTELGAMSNRLTSAIDYQMIQKNANTATLSLIKDADFAQESSNYIKAQILQNTTASLLATANQNPSIALMLVTGTNLRK